MTIVKSHKTTFCTVFMLALCIANSSALEKSSSMIPIYKDPPSYPRTAIEQGIQGWVYTEFTVNEDGTVDSESIVVLDEEPARVFTDSALISARSLRYVPKLDENGRPIDAEGVTYLFQFSLKPGKDGSHFSDSYSGRVPPADYQS